jgi:hypothetical protein
MGDKFAYPVDFRRDGSGQIRVTFSDLADVVVIAGNLAEAC